MRLEKSLGSITAKNTILPDAYTYVPNRFPLPTVGNEPLQDSPTFGRAQIKSQGIAEDQHHFYVVISIKGGKIVAERRVPVEDILKHVSPAQLDAFERKIDAYEAEVLAIVNRNERAERIATHQSVRSVPRVVIPVAESSNGQSRSQEEGSIAASTSDQVAEASDATEQSKALIMAAALENSDGGPPPSKRRRVGRPRREQTKGAVSQFRDEKDTFTKVATSTVNTRSPALESTLKRRGRQPEISFNSPKRVPASAPKGKAHKTETAAVVVKVDPVETEEIYEVEEILDHKVVDGVPYYRVKWLGYGYEEATWEGMDNLEDAEDIIQEYLAKKEASSGKTKEVNNGKKGKTSNGKTNEAMSMFVRLGSLPDEGDD